MVFVEFVRFLEYVAYEDLEGEYENDLKNGGYRPFINYLKSFIHDNSRVRLNSEVIRVKFLEREKKILVDTIDVQRRTTSIQCDQVIWTTSLGYLKENFHRIFADEPRLIRQKENAIANLGFGTVNKVRLIENHMKFNVNEFGCFCVGHVNL